MKKDNTGVIFLKLEPYTKVDVVYKHSYYLFEIDNNLYSMLIEDFEDNFVTLGVWREIRINEILDDNNLY